MDQTGVKTISHNPKKGAMMAKVECQNCRWTGDEEGCDPVEDLAERVAPGEVCPVCECPECGAVCHYMDKPDVGQMRELLVVARSVIRDLCFSYRPADCAEHPRNIVGRITALLQDGYDFETSTVAQERGESD
jgi:hypothetical protein